MTTIGRTQGLYWIVGFIACTAAVLVPTPLVEPRYFLSAYLLLRIHSAARPRQDETPLRNGQLAVGRTIQDWVWVELAWNAVVNAVTIGVFLSVTFEWEGWEGKMRFMW